MTLSHAPEGGELAVPKADRAAAGRIVAGNDDSWTLGGTNTWLVADTSSSACVVIDPGPDLVSHIDAVAREITKRHLTVAAIVLTHCHEDHADAAPTLSDLWDVPVRAAAQHLCRGGEPLADGEQIPLGDSTLTVLRTPGHTDDSVSLHDRQRGVLYTGDTVLGGAPTVIDVPGGSLRDYLESLDRIKSLADSGAVRVIAPGHGSPQAEPSIYLSRYRAHRLRRLDEVRQLVHAGVADPRQIYASLYPDVDPVLASGALGNVHAALRFLQVEVTPGAAAQPAQHEETP